MLRKTFLLFLLPVFTSLPLGAADKTDKFTIPSTATSADLDKLIQCKEYLTKPPANAGADGAPSYQCRVVFDMSHTADGKYPPPVHRDVSALPQLPPAIVVLQHSSPFAACSLTTSATLLARDLSTNVGTLLTTLSGFGATVATASYEKAAVELSHGQPSKGATEYAAKIDGLIQTFYKNTQPPL